MAEGISELSKRFEEEGSISGAMWIGRDVFSELYRYMLRYMQRYGVSGYKALFSIDINDDVCDDKLRSNIIENFRETIQKSLRNSDMLMQPDPSRIFLLLPGVDDSTIGVVKERMISAWKGSTYSEYTNLHIEVENIRKNSDENLIKGQNAGWVVVVDDDVSNLKLAGYILSKGGFRVTAVKSGKALLEIIDKSSPDLILLDVKMPEMDGFETLELLREKEIGKYETPVIFLTARDDDETESRGLQAGAVDFIGKPFLPEILLARVSNMIDLKKLQRHLSEEVHRKTQENEMLFMHVVQSLADAIDAKDTYTNGHSRRVADYSRNIAARFGYDENRQNDIYIMGLLHDIGKIGVPSAVINKPGKLTDEEFAMIKTHPSKGAKILENIHEMPELAVGARWHHERFDGRGYPDGIKGEEIPEEARIIAVADAYDAMTSKRSYRDALPQEVVREELLKGRGTQFDPRFADIMLGMMEDDKDYQMREH